MPATRCKHRSLQPGKLRAAIPASSLLALPTAQRYPEPDTKISWRMTQCQRGPTTTADPNPLRPHFQGGCLAARFGFAPLPSSDCCAHISICTAKRGLRCSSCSTQRPHHVCHPSSTAYQQRVDRHCSIFPEQARAQKTSTP